MASFNKYLPVITRFVLGVPLFIVGINKLLWFIPVGLPKGEKAALFLTQLFTSYVGPLVGITEMAAGVCLLFRRTTLLGLLLFAPVLLNIIVFHLLYDMPGNSVWIVFTLLYICVAWFHRDQFKKLI